MFHLSLSEMLVEGAPKELEKLLSRWSSQSLLRLLEDRCPECLEPSLIEADGELVCSRCGYVVEEAQPSCTLPWDTTYALEGCLAWGRSLGDTLPMGQLSRVIARAGGEDLGIRARHIRTIVEAVEPRAAMRLKEEASGLLKLYGFYGDYNIYKINHPRSFTTPIM